MKKKVVKKTSPKRKYCKGGKLFCNGGRMKK